jgi:DNA-binding Lrp family transcriptional regulator
MSKNNWKEYADLEEKIKEILVGKILSTNGIKEQLKVPSFSSILKRLEKLESEEIIERIEIVKGMNLWKLKGL